MAVNLFPVYAPQRIIIITILIVALNLYHLHSFLLLHFIAAFWSLIFSFIP